MLHCRIKYVLSSNRWPLNGCILDWYCWSDWENVIYFAYDSFWTLTCLNIHMNVWSCLILHYTISWFFPATLLEILSAGNAVSCGTFCIRRICSISVLRHHFWSLVLLRFSFFKKRNAKSLWVVPVFIMELIWQRANSCQEDPTMPVSGIAKMLIMLNIFSDSNLHFAVDACICFIGENCKQKYSRTLC